MGYFPLSSINPSVNRQIIELNQRFGFKIIRRPKAMYYEDPPEPTIVMELRLR